MNSGGTLENSAAASASITNISGYNDTLSGLCNFEIDQASGVLSICGVLAGDGTETLVKTGLGTLNLYSNNVYTGSTVISNGTLALPGAGSFANTAAIVLVSNSSVLDLSGNTVSTTLTLSGGQQLSGIGTVNGPLAALAGSTVAPGSASAIGTLTINGSASLSGITSMQINGSTLASDQLNVGANQIFYGGALSVGNLGATPVQGNSFQLFSGGSYGGMFGSLSLPSLAPGLMWQMGQLPANGTINVVALKTPGIMQVGLAGGVLTLQGTNGLANEPYVVLGSTNISAPLAGWTPVYTNSFDGSGNFNISVSVTAAPHEFFTIETQ
jgi:autotransporter-associated beta strand protein